MEQEDSCTKTPIILPSATPDDPTIAGLEGNFRIIRLLGRGTMSSVYLAEQISMARPVALKILAPNLSKEPRFVERFLGEARATARLNHPNIVSAIDFGEVDSRFFLAMEYIEGESLAVRLERDGLLDEKRVLDIGLQIISALIHANENNVIHLDIKPANIVICGDGRVKLADFGLAMILDKPVREEMSRKAVGTPYYMSPEQVEGGHLDWRSDQFSLGASLYEAVTGRKAFQGETVSDVLVKRFFDKPLPAWKVSRNKVSRSFSAVLGKMLSRSPEGRYQSFTDLETDFLRIQAGKQPAVARISSEEDRGAPISSAWASSGYAGVVERVDSLLWRQRWNWLFYSAILFLGMLVIYGAMHASELVGPTPPRLVANEWLTEAENLPPDVMTPVREMWLGALRLCMKAEKDPSEENLRRAAYSLRLIANNREYRDTAYGNAARNWSESLNEKLRKQTGAASTAGRAAAGE